MTNTTKLKATRCTHMSPDLFTQVSNGYILEVDTKHLAT
jgi:hypothetical protein